VHVQNAEDDRAGLAQDLDASGVALGDAVAIGLDPAVPGQSLDRDIGLDGDGRAVQT